MRITVKNSLIAALIMLVFLIAVITLLTLMRIDRKVIVPGSFTYRHISPVIIEESGFVNKIFVTENSMVKKNDTLIVIRNEDIDMEIRRSRTRANIIKMELDEILHLKEFDTDINSYDITKLKEQLEVKKKEHEYYKNSFNNKVELYKKNIISKDDYEEAALIARQTGLELINLEIQIKELSSRLKKLDTTSLISYDLKHKELEMETERLDYLLKRKEMLTVKARIDGKIIAEKLDNLMNTFLSKGEKIADLVSYSDINFTGYAKGVDIIRVREGQEVFFNVDTFRGRDFIRGEVERIGSKTKEVNGVVSYPIEIEVISKEFFDRGRKRYIHAGVVGEAVIITEEDIPIMELLWERVIKFADIN